MAQNLAPSAMQAFLAERQVRETGGGVAAKTVPLNARNQANDEFISAVSIKYLFERFPFNL